MRTCAPHGQDARGKGIACPVFETSGNEKGGFLCEEPAFLIGLLEIGAYTMP